MNLWSTFLELDELYENDNKNRLDEWKLMPTANQQSKSTQSPVSSQPAQSTAAVQPQSTKISGSVLGPNGKPIVVIVSDQGRLRAMGTDGTNPYAFVAFPNNLRNQEGQIYEVDQLIWNGKNYRVSGNITPLAVLNSTGIAAMPISNNSIATKSYID